MSNKTRVYGTYNPTTNTTNIVFGGTHHNIQGDKAKDAYLAVHAYNVDPSEENLDTLQDMISPMIRTIGNLFNGSFFMNEDTEEYFMEGTTVPLPEALVSLLKDYEENNFPTQALANFWSLCLLNPNSTARDSFLKYCLDYNIVITDMGYVVLYKAVTHKSKTVKDQDLAAFVGQAVTKAKRHRKSLKSYNVYRVPEDTTLKNGDSVQAGFYSTQSDYSARDGFEFLGTLDELHADIENLSVKSGTVYTDRYTRTMDIHLGVPQYKNREECDPDINIDCSHGLHVGSYQYVKRFAYGDDTIFACLVNPANVVAIPQYDTSKIRVCEYYPYSIMERSEEAFTDDSGIHHPVGSWFELDSTFFETDYAAYEVEDLKKGVMGSTASKEVVVKRLQQIGDLEQSDLEPKEQAPNDR